MLNTSELTHINHLLPTTDYHAITENQAQNISVAFKECQANLDNEKLKNLYTYAKPLCKFSSGAYYQLKNMSIADMTKRSYISNPKMKGNPLNLRKIAVMPTLHSFNFALFPIPSVKEVLSQLPKCLQDRNIFFHTTIGNRFLTAVPLPEGVELYQDLATKNINNILHPSALRDENLHVAETTFFELARSS